MTLINPDIPSSRVFDQIALSYEHMADEERQKQIKKTNGIFQLIIKNGSKQGIWTIDMKKAGTVTAGAGAKPDCVITLDDSTFQALIDGKVNGQKAFMSGKLKVKGNIMLATKLDNVLKGAQSKL